MRIDNIFVLIALTLYLCLFIEMPVDRLAITVIGAHRLRHVGAKVRDPLDIAQGFNERERLIQGTPGGPKTIKAGEALEEALCFGWTPSKRSFFPVLHLFLRQDMPAYRFS